MSAKPRTFSYPVALLFLFFFLAHTSHARMHPATCDELAEIHGQALLDMSVEQRTVSTDSGGMVTYDALVLKMDAEIVIDDLSMDRLSSGYYDDGNGEGWDVDMNGDYGVTLGAGGYPLTLSGIRIEVAVDDLYASDPNLMFVRMGTDDASGRIRTAEEGLITADGSIQTLSCDGYIESIMGTYANLNEHRMDEATATFLGFIPLTLDLGTVEYIDFGDAGDGLGATDLYLSFSNLIADSAGSTNANTAFNPGENGATTIPGQGVWMHFQQAYVQALF